MTKAEAIAKIEYIRKDCNNRDWSSYDSEPITSKMCDQAIKLLDIIEPLIENEGFYVGADVEGSICFMFFAPTKVNKSVMHAWWQIDETGLCHVWTPIPCSISDEDYSFCDLYYHMPDKEMGDMKGGAFDNE